MLATAFAEAITTIGTRSCVLYRAVRKSIWLLNDTSISVRMKFSSLKLVNKSQAAM